jgi:hypothetical protein
MFCTAFLALVALPATASATSSQVAIDTAVEKAVEYVRPLQEASGEIPGFGGEWMTVSLAAAGVNAADLRTSPTDPTLQDFLLGEYGSEAWGDEPPEGTAYEYETATLVSHGAGLDPARLSAVSNQPAQLAGVWNLPAGSFGDASTNTTIFGILAMRATPLPRWALAPAVTFLRRNQHDDGGWTYTASLTAEEKEDPSEEDMTGAAIAALCGAGVPAYDPAVADALTFLRSRMDSATGGVEWLFGPPNADTEAWVLSGLTACGVDPQSAEWTTGSEKTMLDFLLSLQVPSAPGAGGFGYTDSSAANFFATQDALRAVAGGGFTVPPPARSDPSLPSVRPAPIIAAGTPVPHVLAIELAPGNVRMCKVTAPAGAPLTEVLAAAKAGAHPSGCVTSFAAAGGTVASVDGVTPEGEDEVWLLRLDRHAEEVAGNQPVGFGDAIALRVGKRPAVGQDQAAPASQSGPAGKAGNPGPRGKRGAKGRPGRKGRIVCRPHRRRSGKHPRRCAVKHRHRSQRGSH